MSIDLEKAMVIKLKQDQGAPFTRLFEGMLNDLALVNENVKEFREFASAEADGLGSGDGGGASSLSAAAAAAAATVNPLGGGVGGGGARPMTNLDMRVQTLTEGNWPSHSGVESLALTGSMAFAIEQYERFFLGKHGSKKVLRWKHTLGEAEVDFFLGGKKTQKYTLVTTTLQAAALCRVSDFHQAGGAAALTVGGLADAMNVEIDVAKRIVHSLSCGKYKVLLKSGNEKKVSPEDALEPNGSFKNATKKFSIPMASLDNSSAKIKDRITEDRSTAIQACIVRTMKARKRLAHKLLVSEVLRQLSTFKPEVALVKRQIESLIDREYLKRVDDSPTNEYDYMP